MGEEIEESTFLLPGEFAAALSDLLQKALEDGTTQKGADVARARLSMAWPKHQ